MEPVLDLHDVTTTYGRGRAAVHALDHVSLAVRPGEFVAVMGATGSGKSTLLNCAAGLERTHGGRIRLLGHDLSRLGEAALSALRRRHVGVVFQSFNLLSELTVEQNVLLPCRLGAPRARAVDEVLDAVDLAGLGPRPVASLSGGQRQRVAVARTLVTRPAVVFADEPTGALDPDTGARVIGLLRRSVALDGTTVVVVTHDPVVAAASDRVVVLHAGRVVVDRPTPEAGTLRALVGDVARGSRSAARPAVVGGVR